MSNYFHNLRLWLAGFLTLGLIPVCQECAKRCDPRNLRGGRILPWPCEKCAKAALNLNNKRNRCSG